jgi:hypothetical protein
MSSAPVKPSKKLALLPKPQGEEIRFLDGTRIPTLNDDLVLVRLGAAARDDRPAKLDKSERANSLVRKAGKALSKPGIRRETVFGHGSGRGISAYSVYPADPTKIVRESADGEKRIGRMVGGRFRTVK